jgi:hypothetical protein
MNVREGMRRLGILLGVSGAILGGFVSYSDAKAAWDSHRAYRRFESVMASPAMRKVAKAAQDYQREYWKGPWTRFRETIGRVTYADGAIWEDVPEGTRHVAKLGPGKYRITTDAGTFEITTDEANPQASADLSKLTDEQLEVYRDLLAQKQGKAPFSKQHRADTAIPTFEEFKKEADSADWKLWKAEPERSHEDQLLVLVNLDGIKDVMVDQAGDIDSIELTTGESIPKLTPPALRAYVIPLLYPILGFLLPWGAARVLTWVGSGSSHLTSDTDATVCG